MKRKVGYSWRLREVMATRGMFTATELVPLLRERGIELSASQVHRLVSGTPERLSLQLLLYRVLRHSRLHPGRCGRYHRRERRRPQDRHRRPAGTLDGGEAAARPARILPDE